MNKATEAARNEEPLIIPALAPQECREILEVSFDHEAEGGMLYPPALILVLGLSNGMTPSVTLREESIWMLRDYLVESLRMMKEKRQEKPCNIPPKPSSDLDWQNTENVYLPNIPRSEKE